MPRIPISEAAAERMCDFMVQDRLQHSSDYQNAENSEQQSAAEQAIGEQAWKEINTKYKVTP